MGLREWFAEKNAPSWGQTVVFIDWLRDATAGIGFASDSLDDAQRIPGLGYLAGYTEDVFAEYMDGINPLTNGELPHLLARGDAALATKIPYTDDLLSEALIQYHQACTQLEFYVTGPASLDADEEALVTICWRIRPLYEQYVRNCYARNSAQREALRLTARTQLGKLQSKYYALTEQIEEQRKASPIRRVALTSQQQRDELRSGNQLSPATLFAQDLQQSADRITEQVAQDASQILSKLENDLSELFPSEQEVSVETFLARSGEGTAIMEEYMTVIASLTTAMDEVTELCATVEELYETLRSAGTQPLITPVSHMSESWVKMCDRQRGGPILTTGATRLLQRCLHQYSRLASSELQDPAFLTTLDTISSYFDQCSEIVYSYYSKLWTNEEYDIRGSLGDAAMKNLRDNLSSELYPVCGLIRTALQDAYFLYRQHSQEGTDLVESVSSEV